MFTQSFRKTALALFAAAAFTLTPQPLSAQMNGNSPERIEFTIDVAEDMNLFVEPRVPVGAEPLRGSFFVTEGKIFPAGTIPGVNGDQFDPNAITVRSAAGSARERSLSPARSLTSLQSQS